LKSTSTVLEQQSKTAVVSMRTTNQLHYECKKEEEEKKTLTLRASGVPYPEPRQAQRGSVTVAGYDPSCLQTSRKR
jgi:hypothetical protein